MHQLLILSRHSDDVLTATLQSGVTSVVKAMHTLLAPWQPNSLIGPPNYRSAATQLRSVSGRIAANGVDQKHSGTSSVAWQRYGKAKAGDPKRTRVRASTSSSLDD